MTSSLSSRPVSSRATPQITLSTHNHHRLSDENSLDRVRYPPCPKMRHSPHISVGRASAGALDDRSSMDGRQLFPDDVAPSSSRRSIRPSPPSLSVSQHSHSTSSTAPSSRTINSISPSPITPLHIWMTPAIVSAGYVVVKLVNQGNFGTVLKAKRLSDSTWVAIKVVNKRRLSEKEAAALRKQAITLQTLKHRYIVQFHHEFEDNDFFYHVFEFLHGGDLYDRLQARGKPFSEAQVLFLARQLFYSISYLHSKRAAHRDIKLENFVFETSPSDQRQVMKLIDFDLLVVRNSQTARTETCTDVCGTIFYVSPEIASEQPHVPEESDMWACGVMLYVLLSYHMPFQGPTGRHVLRSVRSTEPHFAPTIWSHISPETKSLVKDLLTKTASDRPTAEQALERVKNIQTLPRHFQQNGSRLRAITRGIRSVSLNLWDPSGHLVRRGHSSGSRKAEREDKNSARCSRSNLAAIAEDESSVSSSMRSSFMLHSAVGSDANSEIEVNSSDRNRTDASIFAHNEAAMPVPFKTQPFNSTEFLTSPALGGVLARKRTVQSHRSSKGDSSTVSIEAESSSLRASRRLRKGGGLGSRIRNWIHFGGGER